MSKNEKEFKEFFKLKKKKKLETKIQKYYDKFDISCKVQIRKPER